MSPSNKQSTVYQSGFSLIEIMVGLVIGLLATLVILQVFSVFEGQKRTTTGSADAQTNGSIALYAIQRELQMAGYGLLPVGDPHIPDSAIECSATTIDAATGINDISPVTLTDGGVAGGSDRITIRYSTSDAGGIPSTITGLSGGVNIDSSLGCQNNDIALIMNGGNCNLTKVNGLIPESSGVAATITLNDASGAVSDAKLVCLGAWREITYSVSGSNLMKNQTSDPTQAVPIVTDIVNIQAQYGIGDPTATNSNRIVQWVDASGTTWGALPLAIADRNRIKAVRLAVVARNGLMEKTDVTAACSSLTSDEPTGLCSWSATSALPDIASPAPAIDLSADPDWKRYRYRVFQTIIPLRNVIWAKGTL